MIREVLEHALEAHMLIGSLAEEFVCHLHEAILDRGRNFTRMRTRNLGHRESLPNSEKGLDLSNIIPGLTSNSAPGIS